MDIPRHESTKSLREKYHEMLILQQRSEQMLNEFHLVEHKHESAAVNAKKSLQNVQQLLKTLKGMKTSANSKASLSSEILALYDRQRTHIVRSPEHFARWKTRHEQIQAALLKHRLHPLHMYEKSLPTFLNLKETPITVLSTNDEFLQYSPMTVIPMGMFLQPIDCVAADCNVEQEMDVSVAWLLHAQEATALLTERTVPVTTASNIESESKSPDTVEKEALLEALGEVCL